jgi:hypothetical protein
MIAEGHPQADEFETFEALNLDQPTDLRAAQLMPGDNQHYEELRASTQTFP